MSKDGPGCPPVLEACSEGPRWTQTNAPDACRCLGQAAVLREALIQGGKQVNCTTQNTHTHT